MSKPRLLDLFCGAGGAAMGYSRAGFDVLGIDVVPQPRYPFLFIEADAIEVLQDLEHLREHEFSVIHASPPCQTYSRALRHMSAPQPKLIDRLRELLQETGLPWVIENVVGAPLARASSLDGLHGAELCGTQFGMNIGRHRIFESNMPLDAPKRRCTHRLNRVLNPYHWGARENLYAELGHRGGDLAEVLWREEMGVPWMNRYEGREAIPPAYTEFIGHQLLQHIRAGVVA